MGLAHGTAGTQAKEEEMIKDISKLKYWQIAVIGVAVSVTVMLLLAFAARVAVVNWPAARDGIHIAYLITAAAAAWIATGIYIEAAFLKHRRKQIDDVMDQIAWHQPIDLDDLAVELGLVEKKEDCG